MRNDFFSPFSLSLQALEQPNFIAFVNGSFQAQGVNAFLLSRLEHGERMCGIVAFYEGGMQNKNEISALPESQIEFVYDYNQHPVQCLHPLQEWKREKEKTEEPFYIMFMMKEHIDLSVLAWLRAEYPKRPIVIVITTEGLASYVDNALGQGLFNAWEKNGNIVRKWEAFFYGTANSIYKSAFVWWLKRQGRLREFKLLSFSSNGMLTANGEVIQYFREAFEKSAKKKGIEVPFDYYENTVLFNTQPFVERQRCFEMDELVLAQACKTVKDLGFRAVLKPHPAEKSFLRYEKLGFEIDFISEVAQEYLLAAASCKPIAVVGFSSTTLLTANLFWGIPAISLANCINLNKIDGHVRYAAKRFITRYKELQAPKDMLEFASLLNENMEEGENYGDNQN